MRNILILLSLVLSLGSFSGCTHIKQQTNATGTSLVIDPIIFHIENIDAKYIEVFSYTTSLAGANVSVGTSQEVGFGLSKALPTGLFANGPVKLNVTNRKFLELLLDSGVNSEEIIKYRRALGIDDINTVSIHEKGEWLFITLLTDLGAVAYGATDGYELVFQINHNEGLPALNELIAKATLVR